MLIKIDRGAPAPVHRQILEGIKALIENGTLAAGQALPPSRSLARRLGVNRSTVYQAYSELQAQGYLLSRPGSYNTVQARRKGVAYEPGRRCLIDWGKASTANAREVHRAHLAVQAALAPRRTAIAGPNEKAPVDFASLEVDPRLYPLREFRSVVGQVLLDAGPDALRYGHPQGYAPLREGIARRLRLHGISVSEKEILVTSGSQQGLDLIIRLLCPPGSRVVVESPTYGRFLPLLELNGVKPVTVPMKAAGMDLDALEKVLAAGGIRFIYTMPNFQNPTGTTTAHPHRERLLTLALKYKTPILEDGFEEDMKYFGKVPLPLKSIDEHGLVIYLGTFSKALFSGLRIGWVTADRDCVKRLSAIKRFSDLNTSALTQIAIDRFCRLGLYDLHLKRIHRIYRRRLQLTLEEMERHMPKGLEWTRPAGGYTLWVKMARPVRAEKLREHMARFGVAVTPGAEFYRGGRPSRHFRLCIAKPDETEIGDGIRRLGAALAALPAGAKERS